MLITGVNHRELWHLPPSDHHVRVEPVRLHTFDQPTVGIVAVGPDVVLVCSTNLYTTRDSYLHTRAPAKRAEADPSPQPG